MFSRTLALLILSAVALLGQSKPSKQQIKMAEEVAKTNAARRVYSDEDTAPYLMKIRNRFMRDTATPDELAQYNKTTDQDKIDIFHLAFSKPLAQAIAPPDKEPQVAVSNWAFSLLSFLVGNPLPMAEIPLPKFDLNGHSDLATRGLVNAKLLVAKTGVATAEDFDGDTALGQTAKLYEALSRFIAAAPQPLPFIVSINDMWYQNKRGFGQYYLSLMLSTTDPRYVNWDNYNRPKRDQVLMEAFDGLIAQAKDIAQHPSEERVRVLFEPLGIYDTSLDEAWIRAFGDAAKKQRSDKRLSPMELNVAARLMDLGWRLAYMMMFGVDLNKVDLSKFALPGANAK